MNKNVRIVVEAGIMIALATLLSYIKLFKMPQGGSVTAGSMIPIIFFAYRWGGLYGILVGAVYGLLQYFLDGYIVSIWSLLLDYPIAFACVGVAGFFKIRNTQDSLAPARIFIGSGVGLGLRYVAHVISGMIFFEVDFVGSAIYNSFMGVELAICVVLLGFLATVPQTRVLVKAQY